ncbi:hypothetical protein OC25_26405 [Pedobacter kyungheensis]|uniref:Uncharacterized protein n=1 Tax=Pedobacter kyungheensis TaxID=1069985 RepID=A0A0C1F8G3_9SPHI|nr:hypothetical protein OC25_26405 [Pedobacter kyungheensis]
MLDKLVETLLATAARNEEKSFLPLFWFFGILWNCAKVSTASPAIISYAGGQGADSMVQRNLARHAEHLPGCAEWGGSASLYSSC